jgi:uncharacterized protein YcgL (UPF0745 family)
MTKFIFKDIMIVNIYQTQERVDHNLFINDKREIYSAIPALVKLSYNFPEYLSQFQMDSFHALYNKLKCIFIQCMFFKI